MKFHCSISYRKDEIVPSTPLVMHEAKGSVESSQGCLPALEAFIAANVPPGYLVTSVHAFAPGA